MPPLGWRKPIDCGTPAGYDRHRREHTPPCHPCRVARAAHRQAQRLAEEDQRLAPWRRAILAEAISRRGNPRPPPPEPEDIDPYEFYEIRREAIDNGGAS